MSPEKAKIFLVEDSRVEIVDTRWFLEKKGGHTVIAEAATLEEALKLIPDLEKLGGC